jgi:hypothetical protein
MAQRRQTWIQKHIDRAIDCVRTTLTDNELKDALIEAFNGQGPQGTEFPALFVASSIVTANTPESLHLICTKQAKAAWEAKVGWRKDR